MSNAKAANVQSIKMERGAGESDDKATARHSASPEVRAGITLLRVGTGISEATLDISETIAELQSLSKAATNGDLSRAEAILTREHSPSL